MTRQYSYDYYDVQIPPDCEEDPERRGQLAFLQAEEMSKIYATPCTWYVVSDDGNNIRVGRKRLKRRNVQ